MNIEEFLALLAEQQTARPPGWRLDSRNRIRDADCRCPVESLAFYAMGVRDELPCAFSVFRRLGLNLDAFTAIVAAADGTQFSARPLRQTMFIVCQIEAPA